MNSNPIAKNSFWYGIETVTGLFLTLFTSIIIARSIGPEHLGYFLYLWWIAGIAATLGSLGIPATARKYMSEYFGRGQLGFAKTVFYYTLRLQTLIAAVVTCMGLVIIWYLADRQYRAIGLLMIGSIFPSMVNSVAAGANTALEDLRANVPASFVSTGIFVIAVFVSIYFGWGLLGISIGLLTMRAVELVVRLIPLVRRFEPHRAEPLDRKLSNRMFLFSGQSLVLLLLGLIVWDRSEMIFLKNLCEDIRQVAFYSVAFNITERLLVFSQVFGTATGTTLMVQYGRNSSLVRGLAETSVRYLALIAFPVHLGLAAIAAPLVLATYGSKYSEAVPALIVAACLGIPKAFVLPAQAIFSSWDRQSLIIRWGLVSAVLNLLLDFSLIPKYGAIGAAIANGVTQTFFAAALWLALVPLLNLRLEKIALAKTIVISVVMAVVVHVAAKRIPGFLGLTLAVIFGVIVFLALIRVSGVLNHEDQGRLLKLKNHFPTSVRRLFEQGVNWLVVDPVASLKGDQ